LPGSAIPGHAGPGVPVGGFTSTILNKVSGTDYDTAWTDILANIRSVALNTAAGESTSVGKLFWDDASGTLAIGLKGGNVTLQVGQELNQLVKHADNTGLADGKVVYAVGSTGDNLTVRYALATSALTSDTTIGVMTESATGGNKGFMTTYGLVHDIDTSGLTEGAVVWVSPSVAGGMTTTRPSAPNHAVMVGICIRKHAVNGHVFVMPNNGQELSNLHDVLITTPTDNQVLTYEASSGLWKNKTPTGGGSGTVTSISFSTPLTGGTVTTTGTVGLDQTALVIAESQVTNLVTDLAGKQATLVSGTNIKTVGSTSLLGSGDIPLPTVSGTSGKIPKFTGATAVGNSVMTEDTGRIGIGTTNFLGTGNLLRVEGTDTGVLQVEAHNLSNGTSASTDLVATADTGNDTTNFIDIGINSSTYNDAGFTSGGALDSYVLANGGNLGLIAGTASKIIQFFTGGTLLANLRLSVRDNGTQSVSLIGTPQTQVNNQVVPTGYATTVQTRYNITGTQSLTIQGTGIFAVR
jgi:hypothetical protein